jgi:hypothetical protein
MTKASKAADFLQNMTDDGVPDRRLEATFSAC